MRPFIICILLLFGLESYCQTTYKNGLIVTQSNDTIMCQVPISVSYGNKIQIKRADGKKETILLHDIKYLATGERAFENIKFKKSKKEINKLMWIEIEGKINLYCEVQIDTYLPGPIALGPNRNVATFSDTYVIKKNDTTYYIDQYDFIESVKPFLADAPQLLSRVEREEFTYKNIKGLVEEYNKSFE